MDFFVGRFKIINDQTIMNNKLVVLINAQRLCNYNMKEFLEREGVLVVERSK